MRAQVTLLPNESKKLISKALADMDEVKTALAEGLIVLHPSSSTYFIFEELIGVKLDFKRQQLPALTRLLPQGIMNVGKFRLKSIISKLLSIFSYAYLVKVLSG